MTHLETVATNGRVSEPINTHSLSSQQDEQDRRHRHSYSSIRINPAAERLSPPDKNRPVRPSNNSESRSFGAFLFNNKIHSDLKLHVTARNVDIMDMRNVLFEITPITSSEPSPETTKMEQSLSGSSTPKIIDSNTHRTFYVHRLALNMCRYFDALMSPRWRGTERSILRYVTNTSMEAVTKFLRLLYTGDYATEFDSIEIVSKILQVAFELQHDLAIREAVRYLKRHLTGSNVYQVRKTAQLLQVPELLRICSSGDPSCNLLSVSKLGELLEIAARTNKDWTKTIIEREFEENDRRGRTDLNAGYLCNHLTSTLDGIKFSASFSGYRWLMSMHIDWLPEHDEFRVWSHAQSAVEYLTTLTNNQIKDYHQVEFKFTWFLNEFLQRQFVLENVPNIEWKLCMPFLQLWQKYLEPSSMAAMLEVTPPEHLQVLCEFTIDSFKSSSLDANTEVDHHLLSVVMECQSKAKFWEKTGSPTQTDRHTHGYELPGNEQASQTAQEQQQSSSSQTVNPAQFTLNQLNTSLLPVRFPNASADLNRLFSNKPRILRPRSV